MSADPKFVVELTADFPAFPAQLLKLVQEFPHQVFSLPAQYVDTGVFPLLRLHDQDRRPGLGCLAVTAWFRAVMLV